LAKASDEALGVPDFLARPGLARRPARRMLRTAGLLATLGHTAAVRQLEQLKSSKLEIQTVGAVLESWESCGEAMTAALDGDSRPPDAELRRWVAAITRTRVGMFMRLATAMWSAARASGRRSPAPTAICALYRRMLVIAFRDPLDLGSLAVDGDDLRRAGIPAGPELGKILRSLMSAVIEDPAHNTTDWLLQEAKRLRTSGERTS
jgi:tRNA nucleotidyltransferase (CCA-adding enzyme)